MKEWLGARSEESSKFILELFSEFGNLLLEKLIASEQRIRFLLASVLLKSRIVPRKINAKADDVVTNLEHQAFDVLAQSRRKIDAMLVEVPKELDKLQLGGSM